MIKAETLQRFARQGHHLLQSAQIDDCGSCRHLILPFLIAAVGLDRRQNQTIGFAEAAMS
jgi:hypothetical protein